MSRLLKRRQIRGPEPCALITAHVLSQVVSKSRWTDVDQLLDRVYQVGHKLIYSQPQELVIGNIVRRVSGLIRDEAEEDRNENGNESTASSVSDLRNLSATALTGPAPLTPSLSRLQSGASETAPSSLPYNGLGRAARQASIIPTGPYQSMFNLLSAAAEPSSLSGDISSTGSGSSTPVHPHGGLGGGTPLASASSRISALREEILGGIEEIKDEIGQADDQIASFAEAQIRPGDYVMAYEPSRTVEKFLIKAAVRRRYTLFLVDSGLGTMTGTASGLTSSSAAPPERASRYASLLKRLAAAKCSVIQVAGGAAAAAYMPRVNRIVLEARAIAANGGVLANAGMVRLARAARSHGRAVLVVGGVYRLSPELFTDPEALIEWGDPGSLVRFADGSLADGIEIESALTEYMPPSLIDVYVTNL